jgi:hypothetical protein
MDREPQKKASSCEVCEGTRFWRSRTSWRICAQCHPDPLEALQPLTNQVNGAAARGERMRDAAINEMPDQSTAEESVHDL